MAGCSVVLDVPDAVDAMRGVSGSDVSTIETPSISNETEDEETSDERLTLVTDAFVRGRTDSSFLLVLVVVVDVVLSVAVVVGSDVVIVVIVDVDVDVDVAVAVAVVCIVTTGVFVIVNSELGEEGVGRTFFSVGTGETILNEPNSFFESRVTLKLTPVLLMMSIECEFNIWLSMLVVVAFATVVGINGFNGTGDGFSCA